MSEVTVSNVPDKDPEYVYFVTPARPAPGTAEEQFGLGGLFRRPAKDVQKDWRTVVNQTVDLVSQDLDAAPSGYKMDQVEVSLGFSAGGQLGFIAQAGVEASIRIVFQRQT